MTPSEGAAVTIEFGAAGGATPSLPAPAVMSPMAEKETTQSTAVTAMISCWEAGGATESLADVFAQSGEAVQGVFPLFFVFLFLSSSSLPRNLIEHDWFRTIATYNPVSYLFEGLRSLIIFGWQGKALGLGFLFAGSIALIGVTGSSTALRNRLART